MLISLFCGLAVLSAARAGLAAAEAQSPSAKLLGTWSMKAPLPIKRTEVGVAALDGRIYVVGGASADEPASRLNQEYDPAADRWRDRAPLPRGLSHPGVVGLDHKLYVIGGFSDAGVHVGALGLVFEYDPQADTWRQLAPLSSPRGSVGVAAVAGKIHVIGGRGLDKATIAAHEVYDPSVGTWSKAAPLPTARDHAGVIAVGGKIHVVGGRTAGSSDNTRLHDVYDPANNSWRSAAPLLTARSSGAAVYYRGLILYAGGECNNGKTFSENEAYDPKTDRWVELAQLPAGRHAFGAAAVGEYAYFAGGAQGCGGGSPSDELLALRLP